MGNLFILFPVAVILGITMHRSYHGTAEKNKAMLSFRNFFLMWSISALIIGIFSVFFRSSFVANLALALGIPFVYFAGSVLIFLPFILYRRGMWIARILSALIAMIGVSIGVILYTTVIGQQESMGALAPFLDTVATNLKYYHLALLSAIFVPIGLFFIREAWHSGQPTTKLRSLLIGLGIIVAGVVAGFDIWVANTTGVDFPDYLVPVGFLLILSGILYPKISQTNSR